MVGEEMMYSPDIGNAGAMFAGVFLLFGVLMSVGLYVYFSLVLWTLAKKFKYKNRWLAWIPIAQFALFPIFAKKHWAWAFILLVPIVNFVFMIIWTWKIFERRKYPGALSLISIGQIIPVIGWFAGIAMLVIWGLVAWSDKK